MKKAIAIILCAVMLLPAFSFASFAEAATITTWDQFAAAHNDPSKADYFPATQIAPTASVPTVDGNISSGEYLTSMDLTKYETDITDGGKYEHGGGTADAVTADVLNMYVNETDSKLYFAFEMSSPDGAIQDLRIVISPQATNEIPAKFTNGSPKQIWTSNGKMVAQSGFMVMPASATKQDAENDKVIYEFAVWKSELERNFTASADMTCFTFGAWVYNCKHAIKDGSGRYGIGYEMNETTAAGTPITFLDNKDYGWDDSWLYFKLANSETTAADTPAWEDMVEHGLPFTTVSPVTAAPVIDAVIDENEYSTKMSIKDNVTFASTSNSGGGIVSVVDKATLSALLPDTFDVYMASDTKNIYVGMKIDATGGFDGSELRFVSDFTDSKYADYKPMTTLRNIEIGIASNEKDGISNIGSPNYKFGYNKPLTTIEGAVEGGYYTVEFILDKQLVKREWSLTGDIRYMNFGIWMWNFMDGENYYRVGYGVDDAIKATIGSILGNGVASTPNYDLDDAIITAKFLDADDTPDPVNTLNLSKWGQQTFYANQKTTVANDYTDGIKDGEYALEYTYTCTGSNSQMGAILGNGTQAGDYFTFFVDYDDDYVYLAFKAHEDTLVPRYGTIAGIYDEAQNKYDNFNLYLGFNNDGTALNASKQIVLQCIPQVETNGKLGFRCNVKTQRAGADAIFDGVTGVWSLMNDNFRVFTGNWDAENKVLSYEIRLSKAEIAKAYGLEEISNVFTLAMCHDGQYFKDKAGTVVGFVEGTDQTGTGEGTASITGGNGIKFWTNYWDGDKYDDGGSDTSETPGTHAPHTELAALFPAEYEGETKVTYSYGSGSGLGFGHNVVMGSSFVTGKPINTSDSASVRFTEGTTGMRFKSTVSKSAYDAIAAKYDNVYVGTVITPAEYIDAAGAFTKADLDLLELGNEKNYLDIKTTAPMVTGTDTYTFVGSIANIKDYTREFAAIGYIAYTDGEGVEHIIYSDTYAVRSVKQVAELALNDFTTDTSLACGYTVANTEIITGKTVYTPYTAAQRTIAKGFAA